jgi:hypothetical protein
MFRHSSECWDRRRYVHWVFQPKKRFGLCVLNYMVTSNYLHLLVGLAAVQSSRACPERSRRVQWFDALTMSGINMLIHPSEGGLPHFENSRNVRNVPAG